MAQLLSGDEIVTELNRLDVTFLVGGRAPSDTQAADPVLLLASMASSDEGRVRLAIIPLMLRRPELLTHVAEAAKQLEGQALGFLMCYYTAAVLMQKKYEEGLNELELLSMSLPDMFSSQLGIPTSDEPDSQLAQLNRVQSAQVGSYYNWIGAYEHAASTFMRLHENKTRWRADTIQNQTPFSITDK